MRRIYKSAQILARDFALFWHVRVPAWLTRLAASLPASRTTQDGAVLICFFITVILLGSGLLG